MYVYIYIYVYICLHICLDICTGPVYIYAQVLQHPVLGSLKEIINIYIHIPMCVYIHMCIYIHIYVYMYTHMCRCWQRYFLYTHIFVHTIYVYIHTQGLKHPLSGSLEEVIKFGRTESAKSHLSFKGKSLETGMSIHMSI